MMKAFLAVYPWDILDADTAAILDRLQGEIGVQGLCVPVAVPATTQIRARDVEPRVFRTRGGLFFKPAEAHYAATRCKPGVSSWVRGRHPLATLARAAAERGLELRPVVSASRTGRLAHEHPSMACKNAFGIESCLSLCLCNPDVRALLSGLVTDLSSTYGAQGVVVDDFMLTWSDALRTDLLTPAMPTAESELLLGACFCESCWQRAAASGIDMAAARQGVRERLEAIWNGGAEGCSCDALESCLPADFLAWQARELTTLLGALAATSRCELLAVRRTDGPAAPQHAGVDWTVASGVVTPVTGHEGLATALNVPARRRELRLTQHAITSSAPEAVVGLLHRTATLGCSGLEVGNYGLLPEAALVPIKQGIRFARRAAAEPATP
ncbi:MAG: hypothetical protein HY763_03035 [Planctomycetes bacterium]|nr:hypothetical protein [Planctomycetota bacterium]